MHEMRKSALVIFAGVIFMINFVTTFRRIFWLLITRKNFITKHSQQIQLKRIGMHSRVEQNQISSTSWIIILHSYILLVFSYYPCSLCRFYSISFEMKEVKCFNFTQFLNRENIQIIIAQGLVRFIFWHNLQSAHLLNKSRSSRIIYSSKRTVLPY